MCGFKPGDEVVCVDARPQNLSQLGLLTEYAVYRVSGNATAGPLSGEPRVRLLGVELGGTEVLWRVSRFRKVQRRDLSAWLKTSIGNTDKLDKRQKVKA